MNIICATDFSEPARAAMKVASALARRLDLPLRLVHAFDHVSAAAAFSPPAATAMQAAIRDKLRRAAESLRESGIFVVEELLESPPETGLVKLIGDSVEESIVVMGALGSRSLALRLNAGRIAEAVVVNSCSPVLIVRDAAPLLRWLEGKEPLKVLIAVDSSRTSLAAARWVEQLRKIAPCEIEGVHVTWAASEARRRALAHDLAQNLERAVGQTVPVDVLLNAARPADALAALAAQKKIDLLIVGSHEKSGESRWHQSIPYALLELAPMSIVVVPSARVEEVEPEQKLVDIVVATDLSPAGNQAVAYAYSIAHGARIHLVHVVIPVTATDPLTTEFVELTPEVRARLMENAREQLEKLIPSWPESSTEIHVVKGRDVAVEICELAGRVGADLICLATHTRKGLAKWIIGSIAQRVFDRAKQPVLLVRAQTEDEPAESASAIAETTA